MRREEQHEGEVHEENDALRSQTTPLPGVQPGVPLDPGPPWVEAAAVGYVAAGVPLLGAPSLADSSAEVTDGSTLSFLLQRLLEVLRQEREGTQVTRQTWSTLSRVEQFAVRWFMAKDAVGKRRVKRKKKKKTRRTRSRRSGFLLCCSS